jgi:hypothetical protein
MDCYGQYRKSELDPLLARINRHRRGAVRRNVRLLAEAAREQVTGMPADAAPPAIADPGQRGMP